MPTSLQDFGNEIRPLCKVVIDSQDVLYPPGCTGVPSDLS